MLELKTTSITLRGTSCVEMDGNTVQVVTMSATIAEMGHSSTTSTIVNKEAYEANKSVCRADIDAFNAKVREIEDEGMDAGV